MEGPSGFNVWTEEGYRSRMSEAKKLADRHFLKDPKNHHRIMRIAEGVFDGHWKILKELNQRSLERILQNMIDNGWPGDARLEGTFDGTEKR